MTTTETALPHGQDLDSARAEAARAYELDRRHVFHSWSAQAQIKPMTIVASEGSYVRDGDLPRDSVANVTAFVTLKERPHRESQPAAGQPHDGS